MFNNTGNNFNNGNPISVNTRLYSSFSDTCSLSVGAWNEQLSIRFAPLKGVDANGLRQYAQDKTEIITTSLTVDNALAFSEGIEKVIIPALTNKTPADVSVSMGTGENKKILKLTTDGENITLTIYLGINDSNVATGDSISHTFNKREYITSYDPTSGAGNVENVNSDFFNFFNKIKAVKDLSPVVPHTINYSNALKSSFSKPNNNYNNFNKGNNGAFNQAPTSNYASIDDFLA